MRQAVVIIHGVGEQRPMETLRGFVAGVLGLDETEELKDIAFSKPDRISDTLELRRLSVPYTEKARAVVDLGCETDFYELYWQHLMQGTRWRPFLGWVRRLLWRRGLTPQSCRLRLCALAIIFVMAMLLYAIVWLAISAGREILFPSDRSAAAAAVVVCALGLIAWIVSGWFQAGFLERLGDAFRYLDPSPANVAARRAIRTAGLKLLRGLHEDELRRYDRIKLVGHSLGSVIAYDLIAWFWQEQHHRIEVNLGCAEPKIVVTRPTEGGTPGADESPLAEFYQSKVTEDAARAIQKKLWHSHRKSGLPWLITDFITLGSPLTHADVLLADGKEHLDTAKAQREFPVCPPVQEDERDAGLLQREYGDGGPQNSVRILHHGAPFAVTRWTNLYFEEDVIGGPVKCLFGRGIKDDCLGSELRWSSHTHYWDPYEKTACSALREALFPLTD